jgi:hypothetical protein
VAMELRQAFLVLLLPMVVAVVVHLMVEWA